MKKLNFFLVSFFFISLFSCGDCEDKTLEVSENLKLWLPYSDDVPATFVNENNQEALYNILPDVTIREEDDAECTKTTLQPFIIVEDDDQMQFLQVWLNPDEELLGDRDQLWGILYEDDGLAGSGAITTLNNPDAVATTINLNGINYDQVLSLELNDNGVLAITIYLQKNVGIIGYTYQNSTWTIQ